MFRLLAAVAAALILASEAAADPLERHRPVLHYSAKERYFAQPVSLPAGSAEVRPGDRVYGHVAREGGEVWLQYWLFFADNPQDRSPLRTGRHEGDWELVQLRLGPDGDPDLATLSQHSWAEGCAWEELEREGAAPVVYVANGSHGIYSRPGFFDRPFPDPTDEAGADGRRVRPRLTRIGDRAPDWVSYDGPWGDTEAGWVPGESPSPPGPRFQASGVWDAPGEYHEDRAVDCGSGPPSRPWQAPLIWLVVAGLSAVALFRLARVSRG